MAKTELIRMLAAERCSREEMAAAANCRLDYVDKALRWDFDRRRRGRGGRINRAFMGWRGVPLSHRVTSL